MYIYIYNYIKYIYIYIHLQYVDIHTLFSGCISYFMSSFCPHRLQGPWSAPGVVVTATSRRSFSETYQCQWVDLRENLQETIDFPIKYIEIRDFPVFFDFWCYKWVNITPMKATVIYTINHSEMGVMFTNLAFTNWGPTLW